MLYVADVTFVYDPTLSLEKHGAESGDGGRSG